MLKDQSMEFYVNPFLLKQRMFNQRMARVAVPLVALCLALLAAAPARAQQAGRAAAPDNTLSLRQHSDALDRALSAASGGQSGPARAQRESLLSLMMDRQSLPSSLIGRIPPKFQRAAAGERLRNAERTTMDDIIATLTGRGRTPKAGATTPIGVTSIVQTQDVTYPGYLNGNGFLQGETPSNVDPDFSTSERYIYFASNRTSLTNKTPGAEYHIWAIDPSGNPATLVQLTGITEGHSAAGDTLLGERYPSVINDTQIAYTQLVMNAAGVMHNDLYVATLGTNGISTPVQITGLAIHPDGSTYQLLDPPVNVTHPSFVNGEIAFAGTQLNADETPIATAVSHIYAYTFSSGTFAQVTSGMADEEDPAISTDQASVIAFDSNAAAYGTGGSATSGEYPSTGTPKTTRDIWLIRLNGSTVNQFTNASVTGAASDNIEPAWSQPASNAILNNAGADLYLFFSSDRNNALYDIYFLRATDSAATIPNGQLVQDIEGGNSIGIGRNIAAQVNTSAPSHHTDDSFATPINNYEPTISVLNSVLSVVYISPRYHLNGVSDNPLDPNNELTRVGKAGYPALPAAAQDNESKNLTTDPSSAQQGSDEILSSRLVDIDPPALLPYDSSTGEVIHIEDQTAQTGRSTRLVGPGNTAQFILRLSDRQTGIGRAFLEIKDPNSKYQQQSGTPLEHKVYTRYGGLSAPFTMHDKEFDESTTLFDLVNFAFGLNSTFYTGSAPAVGDQEFGASIAGASGGQTIVTGGLLVYPRIYSQVNTVVNTVTSPTTITVNATPSIDDFVVGDTLLFTNAGNPAGFPLSLVAFTNNQNGTYTFTLGAVPGYLGATGTPTVGDTVMVENTPVEAGVTTSAGSATSPMFGSLTTNSATHFQIGDTLSAPGASLMVLNGMSGPDGTGHYAFTVSAPNGGPVNGFINVPMGSIVPISVVARFDPQGQEVDCEAVDAGFDYTAGGNPVYPTVDNYTVPVFTPGVDDISPLSGQAALDGRPDVDNQTGPINRATGNSVWLQLSPFVVSATVAYAVPAGTATVATVIPVDTTSGIVPGDTVTVGTEQVVVDHLAIAKQQTGIPDGTPEIVLAVGAPTRVAHATGEGVTLTASPSGGVLYEATWVTPATPSDYFIDAITYDNAAFPLTNGDGVTTPNYTIGSDYNDGQINWRIYDNVWGFSTLPFTPTSGPAVLVVSDYALPQKFFKGRFGTSGLNNLPDTYFGAESYLTDIAVDNGGVGDYLTGTNPDMTGNYGGVSHAVTPSWALSVGANTGSRGIIQSSAGLNGFANAPLGYPNGLGVNSYLDGDQGSFAVGDTSSGALLATSQKYDIWRVQARGPIPATVLNAYAPTITTQPDVNDSNTHLVQVANDLVIWVSPFTGNQYSTLGTIFDPDTQTTLESFIDSGGRFFLEGQDVGFSLTDNTPRSTLNNFYTNYLKATYLGDTSTFTANSYLLTAAPNLFVPAPPPPGIILSHVLSYDAFRNIDGKQQHAGFVIANANGVFNYTPPASNSAVGFTFQTATVSHTPFSGDIPEEPYQDATTRTDGSMDSGYGTVDTNNNADALGNMDSIIASGGSGIVFQLDDEYNNAMPAQIIAQGPDFVGSGYNVPNPAPFPDHLAQNRLLYYLGYVKLTLTTASNAPLAVGATTIPLAVPFGSTAASVLSEVASAGNSFVLDTGTNAETVAVASSTVNGNGVPVITLTSATTKAHMGGVSLAGTLSADFTSFVGYSSFGLETISQEMFANTGYTPMNSVVKVFSSVNRRTNIIHNLICTTRTGTLTGIVTNTGNPQRGVVVQASIRDVVTGRTTTYTSLTDVNGRYFIQGALPGLYSFAVGSGYSLHQVLSKPVHGGDTQDIDIQVNPEQTGSVVVTVTDKLTGMPIGGVAVTLNEVHDAYAPITLVTPTVNDPNTGAIKGQVTFTSVPPSNYFITYAAAGYDVSNPPDATGPMQTPANDITVGQGAATTVATVLSPAPATVFGLATSVGGATNGQPLQGVSITFTNAAGTAFTTTSGPSFNGPDNAPANYPLNDDLTFSLPATPTGITYTYSATIAGYVPLTGSITVTSGQSVRLDLPMIVAGFIRLIVVNSATGQPIIPPVTATATAPGGSSTTVTSGGTPVPVIPNTTPGYTVTLPPSVGGGSLTLPVSATQTVTFMFTVTPFPSTVTGTITDQGTGAPIAGAVVTLTNPNGRTITSAPTGANGVYTITNVPSGITYSATAAATNFTSMPVPSLIVAPSTTVTQNFMLQSVFGTVTGTVTNSVTNGVIAGATVTLTGGGHTYTGTTGTSGIYTITGVVASASPYTASVTASGYVTNITTGLIVPADRTLTKNFKLTSTTGTISGTVTDASSGSPVPGATVTLVGGGHTYTATTNTAGAYSLTGVLVLPAGTTYTATAVGFQYKPSTAQVTINPSANTVQNFVLTSTIIHHYPAGLQMFSAPYDYTGQPLASILQGEVSKTTGQPVNLVAAWIPLVSAYALTPASPCESLHLGQGYWARFGPNGGLLLATGTADTAATAGIPLQAGWNMIGDPYTTSELFSSLTVQDSAGNAPISFTTATSASVNFINPQLYSYNQGTNSYTLLEINNPFGGSATPSIDPYVGYWIYAYTPCTLIFTK